MRSHHQIGRYIEFKPQPQDQKLWMVSLAMLFRRFRVCEEEVRAANITVTRGVVDPEWF